MFVKSEKFQNKNFLNLLKYTTGLKSILNNFKVSQKNILDFLNKCKLHEKEER